MQQRSPELDGLRGLAVVLVVVSHVSNSLSLFGGMVGVTMFFVLSGFLITRNLLREHEQSGRIDLRRFVGRRLARLAPALVVVVLVGVTLAVTTADPWATTLPAVAVWFVAPIANVASVSGIDLGPFEHFWSLAVEEQFYLAWPVLLLVALPRLRATTALRFVIGMTALALAWRAFANVAGAPAWATHGLDTSAYALLLGASVAFVRRRTVAQLPSWTGLAAVVVCAGLAVGPSLSAIVTAEPLGVWVEPVTAMLTGVVLLAAPARLGVLRLGVLRWFGTISYGLYLWHFVLLTVAPGGSASSGAQRIAVAAVSVGIAATSWYALERPVLRSAARPTALRASPPIASPTTASPLTASLSTAPSLTAVTAPAAHPTAERAAPLHSSPLGGRRAHP